MRRKDVTKKVRFGDPEGEGLPLLECICGETFEYWDFAVGIYDDMANSCVCGRKFVFQNKITVYQVVDK